MRQHLLLAAFILLGVPTAHAETVSIANMDVSREAILLEAALKRFLRDDGYTVKGASTEGFVVLLHGMSVQTRQGASVGVVGSATVVKVLQRESTAALLPEGYPQAQEFVGTFTAVIGIASDLPCGHHSDWREYRGSGTGPQYLCEYGAPAPVFQGFRVASGTGAARHGTCAHAIPRNRKMKPRRSNGNDSCH